MNSNYNGAKKTRYDLIKFQFALPADNWTIQLVSDGNIERPIRDIISSRKLFSREQVAWFRERNANGCNVFGRPNSTRYILIDDLSNNALLRMKQDGLSPTVVIETSPENYQAWITVSKTELSVPVASKLSKLLASKCGGDPGSADALHLGRLPGLRNKKPKYQTHEGDGGPLVKLRTARTVPIVPDAIGALLDQARKRAERKNIPSPSAFGPCAPTNRNLNIDPSRSPITPTEAHEIYEAELKFQAKRKGWNLPIGKGLRSEADYAVVFGLKARYGFPSDDLATVIMYGSEKAAERGMDYIIKTVSNVCH